MNKCGLSAVIRLLFGCLLLIAVENQIGPLAKQGYEYSNNPGVLSNCDAAVLEKPYVYFIHGSLLSKGQHQFTWTSFEKYDIGLTPKHLKTYPENICIVLDKNTDMPCDPDSLFHVCISLVSKAPPGIACKRRQSHTRAMTERGFAHKVFMIVKYNCP